MYAFLDMDGWGWDIVHELVVWWRHQMETFSALLAIYAGNSPVSGEFPTQRTLTWSFDVFFDLRLIKRLSKHSRGWWLETLSSSLWRHRNGKESNDSGYRSGDVSWPTPQQHPRSLMGTRGRIDAHCFSTIHNWKWPTTLLVCLKFTAISTIKY